MKTNLEDDFSVLTGKILKQVIVNNEHNEIIFVTRNGERYIMHHNQDCCEDVHIEDICGDTNDLIDTPIVSAYTTSSKGTKYECESCTWTFYNINTIKGSVTIRWFGASNGFYSESVDFAKMS